MARGNVTSGILGGTFDPIHLGHLHIAASVMKERSLDNIIFVPARQNPLKSQQCFAGDRDRLAMVSLAVEGRPEYSVDDRELRREGPSYTYTTVTELIAEAHKKGESERFVLILGEDSALSFHQWYRCDDIVDLVDLAIVGRTGSPTGTYKGSPKVVAALKKGATPMDLMDISSTEVRKRLTRGESCGGLIPVKVLDYIKGHHLYKPLTYKEKEHASN